jgi:preprotein translocase subunit SecD
VKGFAFTLGLSTVLDLIVVFLFTHPMVSLLSRSRAFGSPRFTGLANVRTGGIVRSEDDPEARKPARAARPARRETAPRDEPVETTPGRSAAERAAERRARLRGDAADGDSGKEGDA